MVRIGLGGKAHRHAKEPGKSMAATNFKQSLSLVLAHEGGFVNHPKDPGGPTNQGVTQKVYDAFRDFNKLGRQSVAKIADSEVSEIYNKNYWRLCRADNLPLGIDYATFDFAVNSGVSRAVKYLQRLVSVDADGVIGLVTLNAVDKAYDKYGVELIAQYCSDRLAFMRSLPTFNVFGVGWTRRVIGRKAGIQEADNGVVDFAAYMALRQPAPLNLMPKEIGTLPGELDAKAIAPDTPDTYVDGPTVRSVSDLKALAQSNDQLAAMIAAG